MLCIASVTVGSIGEEEWRLLTRDLCRDSDSTAMLIEQVMPKEGLVESIGEVVWKVTVSGGSERMERRVQYEAYSSGWELEHSGCP